jgi:hypothetical protein
LRMRNDIYTTFTQHTPMKMKIKKKMNTLN